MPMWATLEAFSHTLWFCRDICGLLGPVVHSVRAVTRKSGVRVRGLVPLTSRPGRQPLHQLFCSGKQKSLRTTARWCQTKVAT
jgi:hypothetical protein